jgi:hypothetical protein
MNTRRQTEGDRLADRPSGSQVLDRDSLKRLERRLAVALTDTGVLPIEEALI